MAFDITQLNSILAQKVPALIENCQARGVTVVPYFGLRTPQQQGELWRQSRTTAEITAQVAELINEEAPFLASCISNAQVAVGPWATDALPGLSWHQWAEAVDFYVQDSTTGQPVWTSDEYHVLQNEAEKLGLYRAFDDPSIDPGHVQMRPTGTPFPALTVVDAAMKERFGNALN